MRERSEEHLTDFSFLTWCKPPSASRSLSFSALSICLSSSVDANFSGGCRFSASAAPEASPSCVLSKSALMRLPRGASWARSALAPTSTPLLASSASSSSLSFMMRDLSFWPRSLGDP